MVSGGEEEQRRKGGEYLENKNIWPPEEKKNREGERTKIFG